MYRPLILVLAVGRGEGTAGEGWRRMSAIIGNEWSSLEEVGTAASGNRIHFPLALCAFVRVPPRCQS